MAEPRDGKHAFISYVREDANEVDHLQRMLEDAGIRTWRDTRDLWPGEDWRLKIEEAITSNSLVFIACFSHHSLARASTYQNDEIALAIDQMRLRRPDQPWLLPVRLSDCEIPRLDLGGGRNLRSLQRVDLFSHHWDTGIDRLVNGIRRIMAALESARQQSADTSARSQPSAPPADRSATVASRDRPAPPMRSEDLYDEAKGERVSRFDDREWGRLIALLVNGDCTPIIGAGVCQPTIGELGRTWASDYQYPFGDGSSLPEVMHYASVIERDPVTVKQRVSRELSVLDEPDFTDPSEPHTLLARFPIKTYLTTNYDDFMAQALRRVGKSPVTAACPWYEGADRSPGTDLPPRHQPRSQDPLVYHLHGSFTHPASLVLTEQDYVEFLYNLATDRGMDTHRMIPVQVISALTQQPLLFIGYSLRDWSFRMLFQGLVGRLIDVQRRRHIGVQLALPPASGDPDARRRAEYYLAEYFNVLNISVYWGSVTDFCSELARRIERPDGQH